MLVTFSFKNYGPFREEAVFDMRAIKSYKEHSYNLFPLCDGTSLLKVASIYGANASGKSNFVRAYRSFMSIVRDSFIKNDKKEADSVLKERFMPFLFDDYSSAADTEFNAVYYDNNFEYTYGFTYDKERIKTEWLYTKNLDSKSRRTTMIFEREEENIKLGQHVKKSCEKYLSDIDVDVLVLSFFSSLKLKTSIFKDTIYCITDILPLSYFCDGNEEDLLDMYFSNDFDEEEKPKFISFLNAIDVGIDDIEVEKNENNIAVYTYHRGSDKKLHRVPFEIESDGTKRAIAFYFLVRHAVLNGKGIMIDEFNSKLHPLLQKFIIDMFYDNHCEQAHCGQLIYTTHDTFLLDKKFMRRDQIWFTSKNEFGESSLFSLAEFKIRNDKSFGKDYLSGIYGGIPILKEFKFKEENDGEG